MKYRSKLKRNSKFNRHTERFKRHKYLESGDSFAVCSGKRTYDTYHQAEASKRCQRNRKGRLLGVYRCPHCKKYHLTGE